ncbi:hypothetical protein SAMD00019534_119820 [Acytostelium subglobosum LB1]|uniref:hypothetical protein n=1 Tax=Acytostelium subglobosum LB1 TaxID=1410327 RepID=UPI000645202D|nr:hypothetical protein SAMD00019534_119820 [Acytostelium subglobosum LB1]GAM28806.1 hypothetical protein SAMD00019534_119820 [Acytostelium subglobosum LB1]|eukprot:XP_012748178.1 hypothetical protein SAMD00019534_119820 [Acytostelium subglobosum LB1]
MGGCFSKQNKKKVVESDMLASDSSAPESKKLSDDHKNNLNLVAINWKCNTVGIWKRNHDKLAIHTDVPRLGHKIDIIDKLHRLDKLSFQSVTSISLNNLREGESPTYTTELSGAAAASSNGADKFTAATTLTSAGISTAQVLKKEEVVLQVLLALAQLLDGPEKRQQINDQYTTYIKGVGDISQQLLSLLTNVVGEESRMMQLLKVCHQKIILPAYYFIKANIYEEMPFRDKRGSWRMSMVFEEDGSIAAIHSKRQQSTVGPDADPEFEFEWTLSIIFDRDMQILALKVDVVDLIISNSITVDRKQQIQNAFANLQSATTNSNNTSFKSTDPITMSKIPDS